jgi:hypothetical protein
MTVLLIKLYSGLGQLCCERTAKGCDTPTAFPTCVMFDHPDNTSGAGDHEMHNETLCKRQASLART